MSKPDFIKNYRELQGADNAHYPDSAELLSVGAPLGKAFSLKRMGIHHELLKPGRRTSYPHAESLEDEFIYVISGTPDAWIDGELHRLEEGDAVGFPAGTGICHTFINNTTEDVCLLVVGDVNHPDNKVYYPLNPERRAQCKDRWWGDCPKRILGSHDGLPDAAKVK